MKLKNIIVTALLIFCSIQNYAQPAKSRLSGFEIPKAGTTLTITYNPKGGPLEGEKNIDGFLYMFNDYKWQLDDVKLVKKDSLWTAAYQLPDNCAFVAFKFSSEKPDHTVKSDNNDDKGFVFTTQDKQGRKIPGGSLAWGIFRKPSLGLGVVGYYTKFDITDEAIEMWTRKELAESPQNIAKSFKAYLKMLQLRMGDQFEKEGQRITSKFAKEPFIDEQMYMDVLESYKFMLKDQNKADSIEKIIIKKYPKGQQAATIAYNRVYNMPLDASKVKAIEDFFSDYPENYLSDGKQRRNPSYIYYNLNRMISGAYFASGQSGKLLEMIPRLNFVNLNEIYRWNIERAFKLKQLPLDSIYPIAKALIDQMLLKVNDKSFMEGIRYSPIQAQRVANAALNSKLAVQVKLLNEMEKYNEALSYLNAIPMDLRFNDASLNEAQLNIQKHIGKKSDILFLLENSLYKNAATPAILEEMKAIYVSKEKTDKGFDKYLEKMKSVDVSEAMKTEVRSKLIKEKLLPFKLSGLNGLQVNSNEFSNKVIVIDFWATWCVPCKIAFPGMQLAADKYAADKEVDFYFIATMERNPAYKIYIAKYIKESGYRFKVLFDETNSSTKQIDKVFSSMVPLFKSRAIPRKIIVKNGYIRYTSEGSNESPTKLADELSYAIEILKEEK
jgi:thiol-disulfide isomerase/thioredoxin